MEISTVLRLFGYEGETSRISSGSKNNLVKVKLEDAAEYLEVRGQFGDNCSILIDPLNVFSRPVVSIFGNLRPSNVLICFLKAQDTIKLNIGGSGAKIFIGNYGDTFRSDVEIWHGSRLVIGDECTCGSARFVLDNSMLTVGRDTMFSDEIICQTAEQHGIIDLETMDFIEPKNGIDIGCHAWIGRRSILMPGSRIGDGSIVGTGSIVTGNIEPASVCVGSPARVIKQNVSWARTRALNEREATLMKSLPRT